MRRLAGVLLILLIAGATLAGCSPVLETDQARLCRMALPALIPQDARIAILRQAPDADGRGLNIVFTAQAPAKSHKVVSPSAAFVARMPANPAIDVVDPGRRDFIGNAALFSHSLLAGDAGGSRRRSRPPRRLERASRSAARGRLRVANGAGRAAAGLDLRAPGGSLFAGLRPDRAHQFRFRRNRRRRRLCGGDRGARYGRLAARPAADRGLRARGRGRFRLGIRVGAGGVHSAAPGSGSAGAGGDRGLWRFSCASSCVSRRAIDRAG